MLPENSRGSSIIWHLDSQSLVLKGLTGHGISSWRQHKYEWHGGVGVRVALAQVKGRRLDKFLSQFASDIFSHSWHNLICPETAHNDHVLQLVESFAPWSGQRSVARLSTVINRLEVIWAFDESLSVE